MWAPSKKKSGESSSSSFLRTHKRTMESSWMRLFNPPFFFLSNIASRWSLTKKEPGPFSSWCDFFFSLPFRYAYDLCHKLYRPTVVILVAAVIIFTGRRNVGAIAGMRNKSWGTIEAGRGLSGFNLFRPFEKCISNRPAFYTRVPFQFAFLRPFMIHRPRPFSSSLPFDPWWLNNTRIHLKLLIHWTAQSTESIDA